jgi:hypothetical protein
MRRAAIVLIGWGLWLGALTVVQVAFAPKLIQFSIPAVAAAICVTAGLVMWALDRSQAQMERARLITDGSLATVTLSIGLAVALLGAGFGLWLILIGAGITGLGLGGVAREQRARSRVLSRDDSR